MSLFTVTIGTTTIEVYGGLDAADAYIAGSIGPGADAWRELDATADADDRARLLVAATRYIDRQQWIGTPNEAGGTTLAFPRDDIEDLDGNAISDADQLELVCKAVFEMLLILALKPAAQSAADQGSNVKSMGAGKSRMEFFAPTSVGSGATKLPVVVSDLIGKWLAGGGSGKPATLAPISGGLSCDSAFDKCDGYRRKGPF